MRVGGGGAAAALMRCWRCWRAAKRYCAFIVKAAANGGANPAQCAMQLALAQCNFVAGASWRLALAFDYNHNAQSAIALLCNAFALLRVALWRRLCVARKRWQCWRRCVKRNIMARLALPVCGWRLRRALAAAALLRWRRLARRAGVCLWRALRAGAGVYAFRLALWRARRSAASGGKRAARSSGRLASPGGRWYGTMYSCVRCMMTVLR